VRLGSPAAALRGFGAGREFDDFSRDLFLAKLPLALRSPASFDSMLVLADAIAIMRVSFSASFT
jgi:hypothetical protein